MENENDYDSWYAQGDWLKWHTSTYQNEMPIKTIPKVEVTYQIETDEFTLTAYDLETLNAITEYMNYYMNDAKPGLMHWSEEQINLTTPLLS